MLLKHNHTIFSIRSEDKMGFKKSVWGVSVYLYVTGKKPNIDVDVYYWKDCILKYYPIYILIQGHRLLTSNSHILSMAIKL